MERKSIIIICFAACLVLAAGGCKNKKPEVTTVELAGEESNNKPPPPPPPAPPEELVVDETQPHGWKGVMKDMRSLDGCQWIIQLDNGTKLQPKNLADFTVVPADGKRVMVDYTEVKNAMGTCMSGKIVKITGIWELP